MSKFGWSYPAGCSGPPDEDYPEACPVCGEPNADEESGDWLCAAAPGFCSTKCQKDFLDQAEAEAAAEHRMMLEWEER